MADLTWHDALDPEQAEEITRLLAEAEEVDGVAPAGEAVHLRLRPGASGSAHLLARVDGVLAGYAHLDLLGDSDGNLVAELAVRPGSRRAGVGSELAGAVLGAAADRGGPVRFWAHGDREGASGLAARLGARRVRELWVMRRALAGLPEVPPLPEGVALRSFEPGRDEDAVVRVNARAFSWHPEQGAMTADDVRLKEAEDWFDADGFLLAVDGADRLLGFHWTKRHDESMGEVYVVGVDPDAQGGGLGKALTLAGLVHLKSTGLRDVHLYVESDNSPAVRVYTRLGFSRWKADVQYAL
ncbi:mycothiol synthase [Actinosynnema pretiosum]|uniref:Mycothiol acetyltransferase n=1 Tax=Actinosynnema pretiosum TaxID=42197 RepID=A0A290ZF73_9PSEU|nr:mycothiol synthase [Actinosynnema pretiosum]ATE57661.1 mycothiol synthase [Actinosynnema pretiosum]